ncbi:hypothetical protein ACFFNY_29855 [Paenibacillus hodogayensis]|uniref:Carboxypeptidase regulatory-like domain-containing protein n=1 Tax=Paenibacillus hodogayensis TaxID=279208 RepID=A0ABV5W5F5_9BACL
MEQLRIVRMKTRVTLVVIVRDAYASGPPFDRSMEVRLAGYPRKPVGKMDGTYIFSDLEPGEYRLEIDSSYYFREIRDVSVGTENRIVHVPLLPLPSYPFEPNGTLVRAMIVQSSGAPLVRAFAAAVVSSEECVKGRLSDGADGEGSDVIAVTAPVGTIQPEDRLLLVGRGEDGRRDVVHIREVLEYQKRFRLRSGLSSAYERGSRLFPIFVSRTTERGELALAFPGIGVRSFRAELRIGNGPDETLAMRTIEVKEGGTVNLGTWMV